MNYIDELAIEIARESGDYPFEDGYAGIELFRQYALLLRSKGAAVTPEDIHDAWAVWASGYRIHSQNIRPFSELTPEYQAQDKPYSHAIQRVARRLVGPDGGERVEADHA